MSRRVFPFPFRQAIRQNRRACRPPPSAWLALVLVGTVVALPLPSAAQAIAAPQEPRDTYADPGVRALVALARSARERVAEGLDSYEGRMWERTYIGISGDAFRRERGLVEDERVARIRWERDGVRAVRWEGYRRESDVLTTIAVTSQGVEIGAGGDAQRALMNELSGDGRGGGPRIPAPLTFDPGSDEIRFGPNVLLSPLADSAAFHYRYQSGDTIRLTLPGDGRQIVLAEVLVEPRRTDFRLVSGSFWFDTFDGSLVRVGMRPARPMDMSMDLPEGDRPPGFLGPMRAEISYVTIEYGLYDLRWWVPRRYGFEGELQLGYIANVPATIEWRVDDIVVNGPSTLIPDDIPEGWRLREAEVERFGRTLSLTVLVPTIEELVNSPELTAPIGRSPGAFTDEELRDLRGTLRSLAAPISFSTLSTRWGLRSQLTRYNRVEGLSTGVTLDFPLPSLFSLHAEARIGVADWRPRGEFQIVRQLPRSRLGFAMYRRLDPSSEWSRSHAFGESLETLLWGGEYEPYHQARGFEGGLERTSGRLRGGIRAFAERHDTAKRNTHVHLSRLWSGDDLPLNPPATEGWWKGASAGLRWNLGDDPLGVRAFGRVEVEGAFGPTDYVRGWTSLGLGASFLGISAAVEGGLGSSTGTVPLQRRFFPGGSAAFRGVTPGEVAGNGFWFARGEIGRARPEARLVLFADWLSVGDRDDELWSRRPLVAVGAGLSLLDGLVRLDLAKNLRGKKDWRFRVYLDGLF